MKRHFGFVLLIAFAELLFAAPLPKFDPLPAPLSNNAVASVKSRGSLLLFSLMGLGPKKTWDATTNAAYSLDPDTGKWAEVHAVPGTVGRLAAAAAGAREHIFLFGGYVVDGQGGETTLPDVNVYEPLTDRWFRAEDMPVAVDDSVAGVYHDRYVYLIGGWSKTDTVRDVQVYDGQKNTAGEQPKYVASDECWMGKIDHHDATKIQWSKLPNHPGTARYRIAAGGSEKDQRIYFSGGTDKPYNYNGVGYDGQSLEPSPVTFAFNVRSHQWETLSLNTPDPTMDHRRLLVIQEGLVIVGGMQKGQQVTSRVAVLPKQSKAK